MQIIHKSIFMLELYIVGSVAFQIASFNHQYQFLIKLRVFVNFIRVESQQIKIYAVMLT